MDKKRLSIGLCVVSFRGNYISQNDAEGW